MAYQLVPNMTAREMADYIRRLESKPMTTRQLARYKTLTAAISERIELESHNFRMKRPDLFIIRVAQSLWSITPTPMAMIQAMQRD